MLRWLSSKIFLAVIRNGHQMICNAVLPDGHDDAYLRYFIKMIRNQNPSLFDSTTSRLLGLLITMSEPLRFIDAAEIQNLNESLLETISDHISAMFPLQIISDRCYQFYHKSVIDWLVSETKSTLREIVPFHQGLAEWIHCNISNWIDMADCEEWVSIIESLGIRSVGELMKMEATDWNDVDLLKISKFYPIQIHKKLDCIRATMRSADSTCHRASSIS